MHPIASISALDDGERFVVATRAEVRVIGADGGALGSAVPRREHGACVVSGDGRFAAAFEEAIDDVEGGGVGLVVYRLDEGRRLELGRIGECASMHGFVGAEPWLLLFAGEPDGGAMVGCMSLLDVDAVVGGEPDADAHAGYFPGEIDGRVVAVADHDGGRVFTAYPDDGALVVWDVAARSPLACLQGIAPGSTAGGSGGEGARVALVDVPDALAFATGAERLVTLGLGSRAFVQLWDVRGGRRLVRAAFANPARSARPPSDFRSCFSLHRDGGRLLYMSEASIDLFDLDALAARWSGDAVTPGQADRTRTWRRDPGVELAAFLPDGEHALAVGGDTMTFFHLDQEEPVCSWRAPDRIAAWAVSRSGVVAVADPRGGLSFGSLEGYAAPTAVDAASFGWGRWVGAPA